jgi:PAS domain S-box-containing protein
VPETTELVLLRETLLAIYREVAPEHSIGGEFLVRKLAAQLYQHGARIQIGDTIKAPEVLIHHSVDPEQRLVWTSKEWNQTLGHRAHAMIGHHISEIMTHDSWLFVKEIYWPELVKTGKTAAVTLTLVTRNGEKLPARGRSEMLRDSAGAFLRTFAKIKTRIPLLVP